MKQSLILLALVAALSTFVLGEQFHGASMIDFRAFYCGARVAIQGHDPYLQEPLYTCESENDGDWFAQAQYKVAVPAPLPGYALAFFAPLALMPFAAASLVWIAILAASMGLTVVGLQRLSGFHYLTLGAVILANNIMALGYGQLAPVALCGLVWAAVALESEKFILAAAALAVASIEPHLAAPAIVSFFIWRDRARLPLLVMLAALTNIALACVGVHGAIEYFAKVLPAHAFSELNNPGQLALSPALYQLGVPSQAALAIGSVQYVAVAAMAIMTAKALSLRLARPSMLLLWPAAAATIGGSYLHMHQIAFVIPLAIVMVSVSKHHDRLDIAMLLLVSVPWLWAIIAPPLLGITILAAFLFAAAEFRSSNKAALIICTGIASICLLGHHFVDLSPLVQAKDVAAVQGLPQTALADQSWGVAIAQIHAHDFGMLIGKVMVWTGLSLACISVLRRLTLWRAI